MQNFCVVLDNLKCICQHRLAFQSVRKAECFCIHSKYRGTDGTFESSGIIRQNREQTLKRVEAVTAMRPKDTDSDSVRGLIFTCQGWIGVNWFRCLTYINISCRLPECITSAKSCVYYLLLVTCGNGDSKTNKTIQPVQKRRTLLWLAILCFSLVMILDSRYCWHLNKLCKQIAQISSQIKSKTYQMKNNSLAYPQKNCEFLSYWNVFRQWMLIDTKLVNILLM